MPARPLPPTKLDPKLIDDATLDLAEAKRESKEASEAVSEAQQTLLDILSAERLPGWNVDRVTVTVVEAERLQLDEGMLRRKLGSTAYRKICKLSLDRKLLEDAMARGEIDANTVAECSTLVPNKPYLRLTERAKTVADVAKEKKQKGGDT